MVWTHASTPLAHVLLPGARASNANALVVSKILEQTNGKRKRSAAQRNNDGTATKQRGQQQPTGEYKCIYIYIVGTIVLLYHPLLLLPTNTKRLLRQ